MRAHLRLELKLSLDDTIRERRHGASSAAAGGRQGRRGGLAAGDCRHLKYEGVPSGGGGCHLQGCSGLWAADRRALSACPPVHARCANTRTRIVSTPQVSRHPRTQAMRRETKHPAGGC